MENTVRPVWPGVLGFILLLTGLLLLARIGWYSRPKVKYPLVSSIPSLTASTNTSAESDCKNNNPTHYDPVTGNTRPATAEEAATDEATCVSGYTMQRAQTKTNDLSLAVYLVVLGAGLSIYQKKYLS